MKISKKKISAVLMLLFILAVLLVQTSRAETANSTAKDKLPAFLANVVGLDLTKYNITNEGYGFSYPSNYGGDVKEEHLSFNLESNTSEIAVQGVFDDGYIYWVSFYPMQGSMIYAIQPASNALDESRNILQRYQTFAQDYGMDTSHITLALSMLNNVTNSPSLAQNSSNLNDIAGFTPATMISGNMKLSTSASSIGWIYTANGTDVPNKSMGIDFGSNEFNFDDIWNLFSIGSYSAISKDEALSIALIAAQNYSLTLIDTNGTSAMAETDWSNITSDIGLLMIPGQTYNNTLNPAANVSSVGNFIEILLHFIHCGRLHSISASLLATSVEFKLVYGATQKKSLTATDMAF